MGDQQAASPESPIFVSNVCSPSALSVLCVHGVLILMRACVGLGGQAGGPQVFVLQGLFFLEGLQPWRLVADLRGRVRCQFWLAKNSPIHASVTDHVGCPENKSTLGCAGTRLLGPVPLPLEGGRLVVPHRAASLK